MADHDAFAHDLAALLTGRAFVDVSHYRKVRVHGEDAIAWLHDLLTADIAGLTPGASCRSLLLTPTGRIRADVQVLRRDDDIVLTQDPEQPDHIGLLLGPYVLSSAVSLEDATGDLALFAVPDAAASTIGLPGFEPSSLGPGLDLLAAQGKPAWRVQDALVKAALIEASAASAEAWRIIHGIARMGPDFDQRSRPSACAVCRAVRPGRAGVRRRRRRRRGHERGASRRRVRRSRADRMAGGRRPSDRRRRASVRRRVGRGLVHPCH